MGKVEIGIYKSYKEYFALGISGYKMREIKNEDKHCLAFEIRNRLNKKGINKCYIRPFKNGDANYFPVNESELETIAIEMLLDLDETNLKIELNNEAYVKK